MTGNWKNWIVGAALVLAPATQGSAQEPAAPAHAAGEHAGGEHAAGGAHEGGPCEPHGDPSRVDIMHHVANGRCIDVPLLPFLGTYHLPDGLTKVSVWMAIASVVLIGLFALARAGAREGGGLVPRGLYNLLESLVVFVRDEIAVKNIGEHGAKHYTPYLLTVFFFILTCNLLGLLPGGVTVTGNINVTAALAVLTLLMMQLSGIREHGVVGHVKNLVPSGVPAWLLPIMIVVEVMGVLAKPFALCVRLFANMTAGHVIILSLLGLIFTFGTVLISPVSIGFALFIFLLELLVAFLQAYIFTMLTALFIGMSVHSH